VDVNTTGDGGTTNIQCANDDDCPFGQACRGSVCTPNDQNLRDVGCHTNVECEGGKVCAPATGRCVDAPHFPDVPPPVTGECADGETRFCGTKVGACSYGTQTCVGGAWNAGCAGGVGPVAERCDGVDNSCDGATDEGFVLGALCLAGTGACQQQGQVVCTLDGMGTQCSVAALPSTGRAEICGNTIDDNCDGQTDEGFTLDVACADGVGACERAGVTVCSGDRLSAVCSAVAGMAEPLELCGNTIDDNCDGATDEGFETAGDPCMPGVGACRQTGLVVCTSDLLAVRCSVAAGPPGPQELCGNTIDDNCDGQTDEGFAGVVGTACQVGTGMCVSAGVWACTADASGRFCQLPATGAELCNMVDDDNDMCTDEGFDLGATCANGLGVCRQMGVTECAGNGLATVCGAVPLTPGPAELCGNGLDDNCSGVTDEGFDVGTPCTAGRGICLRNGARVCSVDRTTTVCDVAAGPAGPVDLCGNGQDDNCDGATDEGFDVGTMCSVGLGICTRTGTRICRADGLATQCSAVAAMPAAQELCGNTLDDDCDGQTDEGFNLGTACTAGQGTCARPGVLVCSADRRTAVCNAVPAPPGPLELCGNAMDDDCDSFTDEGFANLGNACTNGVGICAATGQFACSPDRTTTVCNATAGSPVLEVCDNLDNDCNAVSDNGCDDDNDDYCDSGMTIVGTPSACPRTTGATTRDCNDTDATVNPGATESCGDGRDLDCDGNPNNGCNCGPTPDADFDGVNSLACGGLDCDDTNGAIRPGAVERCDGLDNNCNTMIDEGFDADMDQYTTCGTIRPGGGVANAYIDCADNDASRHPFACELCANASGTVMCGAANDRGNNTDEDCDGYLDETCAPCDSVDRDGDTLSECDGDCLPADGTVSPLRTEVCDGKDTDCNITTQDNCDVSQRCNWPAVAGAVPDACRDRLVCVESLAGNGRPTGNFTCTSFCNATPLGAGLGDGCTSVQTCSARLTPTANLHGCSVNSEIGTRLSGVSCGGDAECRSDHCLRDGRFSGNVRYCTDLCGSDAYCASGSNCQVNGGTAMCLRLTSSQTRDLGATCNTASEQLACRTGSGSCVTLVGGQKQCSKVCCRDSDCPASWHCGYVGPQVANPGGGVDTVPLCYPDATGAHDRPAGAACTSNGQCVSEFCDVNLSVCVDPCCNDAACPVGLRCDISILEMANGAQTFARACVNQTPAQPLQAR